MAQRVESDLDFGIASRITNLPAPAADNDAARRVDLIHGQVAVIADVKAYNVDGGTFTAGAVRKRDLNTIMAGADFVSLSDNEFTPDAGVWLCEWSAPAYRVNTHWSGLYDAADALVQVGETSYSRGDGAYALTRSIGCAVLDVDGTEAFWVGHRCQTTHATFGLGVQSSFAGGTVDSLYTKVTLRRLS